MLYVSYDRSKVAMGIGALQIIGVILAGLLVQRQQGWITVNNDTIFNIIIIAGFLLYAYFNWILFDIINNPNLISIKSSESNQGWTLLYRKKLLEFHSPAKISCTQKKIIVSPAIDGVPNSTKINGSTVINLPNGLKEVKNGTFTVC